MKLGTKDMATATDDELLTAIASLQAEREALHAEAKARKMKEKETGIKEKVSRPKRAPKSDPFADSMLAFLKGD